MKATEIKWDCRDDVKDLLPEEMEIPSYLKDEEEVSDYISCITGYCHKGFKIVA